MNVGQNIEIYLKSLKTPENVLKCVLKRECSQVPIRISQRSENMPNCVLDGMKRNPLSKKGKQLHFLSCLPARDKAIERATFSRRQTSYARHIFARKCDNKCAFLVSRKECLAESSKSPHFTGKV